MFGRLSRLVAEKFSTKLRNWGRQEALDATFTPIAIGQVLSSIESLSVRNLYRSDQLLRGTSARAARPGTVKQRLLSILDSEPAAHFLSVTILGSAVALLCSRGDRNRQIVTAASLAICTALSEHRTPYGRDGADQMTSIITQYRVISALVPNRKLSDDLFLRAVSFQAGLSYLVSGVSKLFGPTWLRGEAIGEILDTRVYGGSMAARAVKKSDTLMKLATWATPMWEIAFPVVYLIPPRWGSVALVAVKGFHIGVAAIMELPRFVWGFTGSHAAVEYVLRSHERGQRRFSTLEYAVIGSAMGVAYMCAKYASTLRRQDRNRRRGLKGNSLLPMPDGDVEYTHSVPHLIDIDESKAPVVIFEAGLGSSLENWSWVAKELSSDHHVVAFHRSGYGFSTTQREAGDIVEELIANVQSTGPIVLVGHSFGLLKMGDYINRRFRGRQAALAVLIDGTDPDLLHANRSEGRSAAKYLQAQVGSMFVALTGIYNIVPHPVARQSAYAPDTQSGVVQFAFGPRNIVNATREYFSVKVDNVSNELVRGPETIVIASSENAVQQKQLAEKLSASYALVSTSSHRSVIGYQNHAMQVAHIIREAENGR